MADCNKLLISGFTRDNDKNNMPLDVINIIYQFYYIFFHFDIIANKYGSNDTLHVNDMSEDAKVWLNEQQVVIVVISLNSGVIRAGFSGEDEPIVSIPNIIALSQSNEIFIGHEVKHKMNVEKIRTIKNGTIEHWDGLKLILKRILSEICTKCDSVAVFIAECVGFKDIDRERITKFLFEELNVWACRICSRAALALYANGRSSGVSVFSDYDCTEIVPVSNCYAIMNAVQTINIGRKDVLRYVEKHNASDNIAVIKELWFNPKLQFDALHHLIHLAIQIADGMSYQTITKKDFGESIVLNGINSIDLDVNILTVIINLKLKEANITGQDYKCKVFSMKERAVAAWIGASIVSSLEAYESMWMTKEQYNQYGASHIHKCMNDRWI